MTAPQTNGHRAEFGVIGLAVMGSNLALNIEEHGFSVAVWNLEPERVDEFLGGEGAGRRFRGTKTFEQLVASVERPRRILMMIKAGAPVDMTVGRLLPLLDPGDILVDGGNSWFKDTRRREAACREAGVSFVGMGVSGGEEGARRGPSLMPGGAAEAYGRLRPVLEAIAAKTDSGACVTHVGPDGAGHFAKMVHNGIEYGDMQLIAEAYDILRKCLGLGAAELSAIFAAWNRGPLESFLVEITSRIFAVRDEETGRPLVDLVSDKAGQKGTGRWTAQVALDLAVPVPTIAAAIDARVLSSMKDERVRASGLVEGPRAEMTGVGRDEFVASVHAALYASKVCAYAQGMSLIRAAAAEYGWKTNLREMARIWKGGCIIRARFLDVVMRAYERAPDLPNLLLDEEVGQSLRASQGAWRAAVSAAAAAGVPVPATSASLAYFDSYRAAELPQNLTQAQRDFFGAHTYERVDKPGAGFVHTDWASRAPGADGKPAD